MTMVTLPRQREWIRSTTPRSPTTPRSVIQRHLLLMGLLVAATIAAVIWFTTEYGGQAATFQATIQSVTPVSSSEVIVGVEVTNLSTSSLAPTCTVAVGSTDHGVLGSTTLRGTEVIAARSSAQYAVTIPVTTNGAADVISTASSVSCQ
jgi:hypothetical protein